MTNEEAIKILEEEANYLYKDDEPYSRQAFDMAIEALSADEPQFYTEDDYWNGKVTQDGDIISRADAIEAVRKKLQDWGGYAFEEHREGLYEAIDVLESLPSADRPSGEWQQVEVIDDDEPNGINTDASECSVCGAIQQSHYWTTHYYNYCPNCGAKMKGGEDG